MNSNCNDILLIEDNPNDALLTIRTLKQNSLANNIIHVSDGQEAIDYLSAKGMYSDRDVQKLPKLILLDLKLPKMDGLEVLASIRSSEATKLLPVVILTSSAEESDMIRSYKLGANSFIVKPVEFEKFTEVIKHLGLYWIILNKSPHHS